MTLRIYCIFLFLSLLPIVSLISRFLLAFLWFVVGNLACSIPGVPEIELGILPYLGQYTTPGNTFSPVYFERYLTKQDSSFLAIESFIQLFPLYPPPQLTAVLVAHAVRYRVGKLHLNHCAIMKQISAPHVREELFLLPSLLKNSSRLLAAPFLVTNVLSIQYFICK